MINKTDLRHPWCGAVLGHRSSLDLELLNARPSRVEILADRLRIRWFLFRRKRRHARLRAHGETFGDSFS